MGSGIVRNVIQNGLVLHTRRINVVFTSSRDAPLRVRRFLNELVRVVPYSVKINRGRQNLYQIFSKAVNYNARYLGIFKIIKGNPAGLKLIDLATGTVKYEFKIKGVTLYLEKVKNKEKIYVKDICIKFEDNSKCKNIVEMLIDLGFKPLQDCDYFAFVSYQGEVCEVKFVNSYNLLIGPIIRFKLND